MGPCGHEFCKSCMERILFAGQQQQHRQNNNNNPPAAAAAAHFFQGHWDVTDGHGMYYEDDDDDDDNDDDGEEDEDGTIATNGNDNYYGNHDLVALLSSVGPTVGRCPICRSLLNLFQVIYATKNDHVDVEGDDNNVVVVGGDGSGRKRRDIFETKESDIIAQDCLVYEKDSDIGRCPIAGRVYEVDGTDMDNRISYHFPLDEPPHSSEALPKDDDDDDKNSSKEDRVEQGINQTPQGDDHFDSDNKLLHLPFMSYESPDRLRLDDGTLMPSRKYFEAGTCHWHGPTRTFHGTILWGGEEERTTFYGSYKWDYIMQFSRDLRYICGGSIVMHRDPFRRDQMEMLSYSGENKKKRDEGVGGGRERGEGSGHCCARSYSCPLDGRWKVTWYFPRRQGNLIRNNLASSFASSSSSSSSLSRIGRTVNNNTHEGTTHDREEESQAQSLSQSQLRRPLVLEQEEKLERNETTANITVRAGCWSLYGIEYRLDTKSDPRRTQFKWPGPRRRTGTTATVTTTTTQWALPGCVDLTMQPHGPPVGESIFWTTDDPNYPRIEWRRETMPSSSFLKPRMVRFGPGAGELLLVLDRRCSRLRGRSHHHPSNGGGVDDDDDSSARISYQGDDLWGNVFVQGLKVGLASYHFVSEPQSPTDGEGGGGGGDNGDVAADNNSDDHGNIHADGFFEPGEVERGSYISYEHPLCALWPRLDDGSPVPSRMPFTEVSWDRSMRTFRGTIDWYKRFGTTWQGCSLWRYEMHFDSEYLCIVSGTVRSQRGATISQLRLFGSTSSSDLTLMSVFGESLVYVNAAASTRFVEMLNEERIVAQHLGEMSPGEESRLLPRQDQRIEEHIINNGSLERESRSGIDLHGNDQADAGRTAPTTSVNEVTTQLSRRLHEEGASQRTTLLLGALLNSLRDNPPHTDQKHNEERLR